MTVSVPRAAGNRVHPVLHRQRAARCSILLLYATSRIPDALRVAACPEHGATAFVTNDARLRRVKELALILLSDYLVA